MSSGKHPSTPASGSSATPASWVPTLYFAEGIPFYAVSLMALIFYQRLGVRNDVIALTTRLLGIPWSLKPLWSPLLEMYKTKKFFVVVTEFLGGLSLALLALCLPLPGAFRYSIAFFAIAAFASSTHDIAADGLYIASLTAKQQAAYAGWQGGFYNVARFFAQGGLIILVGYFETRMSFLRAWGIVFTMVGAILIALSVYHSRVLPSGGTERHSENLQQSIATFKDVIVSFFQKPRILLLLVFIFLYRLGEGQVVTIGPLFLKGSRASGGLGLTTAQFGTIYGTFGTAAFILGTVLGGYFVSWLGLKRAILPLLLILNLPMAAYLYLSIALPTNVLLVTTAMSAEMFGYGFGFVGVILLMMQEVAPGKYQTAHYAFANSLMNLGLIVPGAISGIIQMALGYRNFFAWVLLSSVPALILVRFVSIGEKPQAAAAAACEG
ncbi:MAG TPA: MFS transporter [Candidatus Acidoferrales bacterium]|nr:MFS transporter [Candidatus Acidoferrales bacterium]